MVELFKPGYEFGPPDTIKIRLTLKDTFSFIEDEEDLRRRKHQMIIRAVFQLFIVFECVLVIYLLFFISSKLFDPMELILKIALMSMVCIVFSIIILYFLFKVGLEYKRYKMVKPIKIETHALFFKTDGVYIKTADIKGVDVIYMPRLRSYDFRFELANIQSDYPFKKPRQYIRLPEEKVEGLLHNLTEVKKK